jgi:hypothetical protein
MRFDPLDPPRAYACGLHGDVVIHDHGRLALEADEQVTLTTPAGGEYDVTRKGWGFYATPSLNGRLPRFGLRPVLVRNTLRQWFVLLVERGHEDAFGAYADSEALAVVAWLDDTATLERLDAAAGDGDA